MSAGDIPIRIFVDADACPVKEEVFRVATRCGLRVLLVSNAHLRAMGEMGGGPPPFTARDRSTFLQRLDDLIQAIRRGRR